MIKNEEKKTTVKMRIVIALIALFTLGSTFALYAGIVLNYSNGSATSAERSEKEKRFNELYQEYLAQTSSQISISILSSNTRATLKPSMLAMPRLV